MSQARKDYMREYMKKYRQTENGKKAVKKANVNYWKRKDEQISNQN